MIVHIQLVEGPKQSACGRRKHAIRSTKGESLYHIESTKLQALPRLKLGYSYCEDCLNHPRFQMFLLRHVEL